MKLKNAGMLLLTATIWGTAFVAQSVGMEYVEPFTFNAVRSILGGMVLIPVIFFLDRQEARSERGKTSEKEQKTLILGGICCGIMLFLASNFQQFGVKYTTVGKAGFITACYIVLVPIFGLFLKNPANRLSGGSCACCSWIISALHGRRAIFSVSRRRAGIYLRSIIFFPYPGN